MSSWIPSAVSDLQPSGCVICGEECGHGALCQRHQGIFALAAWVDEGLVGDWAADVGSEPLNHRTMMKLRPIGPVTKPVAAGWLEQLAIIVLRFGYWVGRAKGEGDDFNEQDTTA